MATSAIERPGDQPGTPGRIPAPKGLPVVGHLHQIARAGLIGHLLHVSRDFPQGIFKLKFGSRVALFVTDPDLVAELCDETRFRKMPGPGLRVVRKFAGDGLFTAFSEEPNWGKAHRILLPAFSQRAMKGYFEMMLEVADQLVTKWSRLSGTDVLVADDMTRFTLDSIAVAGFGHRFASFEREELDSFLEALARALGESLNMITRLPFQQRLAKKSARQFEADIAEMNTLVDGIIAERRANPNDGKDLLNLMLSAVDPETGSGFPAALPGVVAVADDGVAGTRTGVYIAPGRDVPTTEPGGRWYLVSGNSYAAAHVSGLMALMQELRPGKTGQSFVSARSGGGVIDACDTLQHLARSSSARCSVPN